MGVTSVMTANVQVAAVHATSRPVDCRMYNALYICEGIE